MIIHRFKWQKIRFVPLIQAKRRQWRNCGQSLARRLDTEWRRIFKWLRYPRISGLIHLFPPSTASNVVPSHPGDRILTPLTTFEVSQKSGKGGELDDEFLKMILKTCDRSPEKRRAPSQRTGNAGYLMAPKRLRKFWIFMIRGRSLACFTWWFFVSKTRESAPPK